MRIGIVGLYNPVLWEYSRVYRWMLVFGRIAELALTALWFLLISVPVQAIRGERKPDLAPSGDILVEGTRIEHRDDYGNLAYEKCYWDEERMDWRVEKKGRFGDVRFGIAPLARILLEKLGPTFVKLGQFLGMRPEMPINFQREFQKLQDRVPPFSYKEVRKILQREYGMPLEVMFSQFDKRPIAAASLAQVHRATLKKEGAEVAVKIQRPYLEATVTMDLVVIDLLLKIITRVLPEVGKKTDVNIVMTGFGGCLRKELDFRREASSQQMLKDWWGNNPHFRDHLKIPAVYWDYVSGKCLVSELMKGMYRLDTEEACKVLRETTQLGIERWDVNKWPLVNMAACITLDVYESRIFYMDAHLGNIYFQPEEKSWVVLDFGMVEPMPETERNLVVDLITSLYLIRDADTLVEAILCIHEFEGGKREDVNMRTLKEKLGGTLERHFEGGESAVQRRGGSDMTADLLGGLATQGLRLPAFLWYFIKACSGLVRIGVLVDPQYDGQQFMCWYMGDNLKRRIAKALDTRDVTDIHSALDELMPLVTDIPDRDKVIPGLVKMLAEQDPNSRAAAVRSKGSHERIVRST